MPVTILMVTASSGSSVMRWRIATIGSSTEPSLPESAAGLLIACGLPPCSRGR